MRELVPVLGRIAGVKTPVDIGHVPNDQVHTLQMLELLFTFGS